jgi:hypothetical protein
VRRATLAAVALAIAHGAAACEAPAPRDHSGGAASAPASAAPRASAAAAPLTDAAPAKASASAADDGLLAEGAADRVLARGQPPVVRLLDAGAEPRAPLAYAVPRGAKTSVDLALDVAMTIRMGDAAPPMTSVPRMVMTLDLSAAELEASGDAKVAAKVRRLLVEPKTPADEAIAKEMRPSLDLLKGLGMTYWLTPTGSVRDVKVALPPTAPVAAQHALASVSQSFDSMVAPLPREPIGRGARWQVVSRVTSSGADLLQEATCTLVERDGPHGTLAVEVSQRAASREVRVPGMPDGVKAILRYFRSVGSGRSEIDTRQLAPSAGKLEVATVMTLDVETGGLGAPVPPMHVDTSITVTFARPTP